MEKKWDGGTDKGEGMDGVIEGWMVGKRD